MKKAVAVPYVIALILGVAVVGLVGYWFATSGGKFSGQGSRTICDNKFLQYCVTNPTSDYDTFDNTNTECTGLGSYTACSQILGGGGGGGGPMPGNLGFGASCNSADDKCDKTAKLKCSSSKGNICLGDTGYSCGNNNQCVNICSFGACT